jgi:hypothetical protein
LLGKVPGPRPGEQRRAVLRHAEAADDRPSSPRPKEAVRHIGSDRIGPADKDQAWGCRARPLRDRRRVRGNHDQGIYDQIADDRGEAADGDPEAPAGIGPRG